MTTTYEYAPDVEKIAQALIRDVPEHQELHHAQIKYVFRDKAARSHGRIVLGRARKVGGLNGFLIRGENEPLFVVEIAFDVWRELDEAKRKALVDHELCHLRVHVDDLGEVTLATRGHDLEEFRCIVERHGFWTADVAAFGSAISNQLALAIDGATSYVEGATDG